MPLGSIYDPFHQQTKNPLNLFGNKIIARSAHEIWCGTARHVLGAGLCKGFNLLIRLGLVPFAPLQTGINLSNRPTEGGRISMKIGGLYSKSFIDLHAQCILKKWFLIPLSIKAINQAYLH